MIARPCTTPGCPNVAEQRGYCADHAVPMERERRRLHDAKRPSTAKRGYGARWQRLRKHVLARNPLCVHCTESGRVTMAAEVHHNDGNAFNNVDDNLVPLCKSCHSRISVTQRNNTPVWAKERP
jgi:5-methylcytosine-specific restriction enzyme A